MTRVRRAALVLLCVLALSGCDWALSGFDAANTRFNAYDTPITAANASTLVERWRAPVGAASQIRVANGLVFASSDYDILAFDQAGSGCAGTPRTCTPIRTYLPTGPGGVSGQSFAISGSTVLAWGSTGDGNGNRWPEDIVAFDATGVDGCDSVARTCTPLRTFETPRQDQYAALISPVVVAGVLYVRSHDAVYAYDAAGVANCSGSPVSCRPLWSAANGAAPGSELAIADGRMYVASSFGLSVFDAAGITNCSGGFCNPMWYSWPLNGTDSVSAPAVANGRVYLADGVGTLRVYDAAGLEGCTGSFCMPLWTAPPAQPSPETVRPSISVGPKTVTITTGSGIRTFDSRCESACTPLWEAPFSEIHGVSASNGLVVVSGTYFSNQAVRIYDRLGVANCAASVCNPVWSLPPPVRSNAPAFIANGQLVTALTDNTLRVYGLP